MVKEKLEQYLRAKEASHNAKWELRKRHRELIELLVQTKDITALTIKPSAIRRIRFSD